MRISSECRPTEIIICPVKGISPEKLFDKFKLLKNVNEDMLEGMMP